MKEKNQCERFTVLVSPGDIKRIKYLAIDRNASASEIVRLAVSNFLRAQTEPESRAAVTSVQVIRERK